MASPSITQRGYFWTRHRLDTEDTRRDYRDERRITIGEIDARLFVAAYALRGEVVRLISARKANPREQRQHHETLST
jgi:uncharacterized DUF497 family protein